MIRRFRRFYWPSLFQFIPSLYNYVYLSSAIMKQWRSNVESTEETIALTEKVHHLKVSKKI